MAHKVSKLYPNTSTEPYWTPQLVYETIITDIRVTCPINTLARGVAKHSNHTTYRLFITHRPGKKVPYKGQTEVKHSFHFWDVWALFNFKHIDVYKPTEEDLKFRDLLRSTYKNFIHTGKVLDKNISTGRDDNTQFPEKSIVLTNYKPWIEVVDGAIHKKQCKFWKRHGFDKYGWHN